MNFGLSREGLLPRWLGRLSRRHRTPAPALIVAAVIPVAALIIYLANTSAGTTIGLISGTAGLLYIVIYVAGAIGDAAATSFFPAKPLGCYGDGGACFTNDDGLKDLLLSLRMHGQGSNRYEHVHIGMNSRLDTIQAAILIEKLKIFDDEIEKRNAVARRYSDAFAGSNRIKTPVVIAGATSSWAQYTLQVADRASFQARLKEAGVPTAVYYPIPLHLQECFAYLGYKEGACPERKSGSVPH